MKSADKNIRHDIVKSVNLQPELKPSSKATWPLQMIDYSSKGAGAGVAVAPRPQPYRLTRDMGLSQPKPGRLQKF